MRRINFNSFTGTANFRRRKLNTLTQKGVRSCFFGFDVRPYSLVNVYRLFRGFCSLHHQSRQMRPAAVGFGCNAARSYRRLVFELTSIPLCATWTTSDWLLHSTHPDSFTMSRREARRLNMLWARWTCNEIWFSFSHGKTTQALMISKQSF